MQTSPAIATLFNYTTLVQLLISSYNWKRVAIRRSSYNGNGQEDTAATCHNWPEVDISVVVCGQLATVEWVDCAVSAIFRMALSRFCIVYYR